MTAQRTFHLCGLMTCRYDLEEVSANNRQYIVDGRIAVAPPVLQALGHPPTPTDTWSIDAGA